MQELLGSFRVNKIRIIQSNIQYAVLFFTDRVLFVKIGGQFADGGSGGMAIGAALGGVVGGLIGAAMDNKKQKSANEKNNQKMKSFNDFSNEELLSLDKHNFEINYGDIIKIEMKHSRMSLNGNRTGVFNVISKKEEKFDIALGQNYEDCVKIVSKVLSDKLN